MTFNEAVDKIMPLVNDGDKSTPFVISRQDGEWVVNYPYPAETTQEFLNNIKKTDPFAITFTGYDLSRGSFPHVYDQIFNERLRSEYENAVFTNTDLNELKALINLVEENIGEFSQEVTEYLAEFDRPLAAIYEMNPVSLVSENPNDDYDYDKVGEFVDAVENHINDLLHNRKKQEIPAELEGSEKSDKRIIEGYEEISAVQINRRLVFFGENKTAENQYMVAELTWDNPFGVMESQWTGITNDYVEAVDKFAYLTQYNIDVVKSDFEVRKSLYGVEPLTLTVADCVPNGLDEDLTGKLIIIKPEILSPEYRRADYQLRVCTGGFGASPTSFGSAVFCTQLFIGKDSRFEKQDVLGVADIEKLPQWAKDRLSEYHSNKNELNVGVSANVVSQGDKEEKSPLKPTKKPTLQEKLDKAKKKAAEQDTPKKDERGDKPKKRDERE